MAEKAFENHFAVLSELFAGEGKCRVESEGILPDYKEEAHRVVRVLAKARVNEKHTSLQDRQAVCEVEGVVTFSVLYESEPRDGAPGGIHSFLTQERFTYTFRTPLGEEEPNPEAVACLVEVEPENVSHKLLGPRKIAMRCDVAVHLTQKTNRSHSFFPSFLGEDMQVNGESFPATCLVTTYQEDFTIAQTLTLPDAYQSIGEVCDLDVFLLAQNAHCEEGGVSFRILCDLNCSYVSSGEGSLVSFYQPIELEKKIGLPTAASGQLCQITLSPNFLRAASDVNENGENKNLSFEVGYTAEVMLFQNEEIYAAEDVFSTRDELITQKEAVSIEALRGTMDFHNTVRQHLSAATEGILRAESPSASAEFKSLSVEDGKIIVEGKLYFGLIGVTEQDRLISYENSCDFRFPIAPEAGLALREADDARIELFGGVRAFEAETDQNGWNLRFEVCGQILLFSRRRVERLTQIERGEEWKEEEKGLVFFYPEEGESLWEICKSNHASPQKVRDENRIEQDALPRVLLITK